MKMGRFAIGTTLAATLLAAACHRNQPGGQVVATVNGEEITLQELNTELQATNASPGGDKQAAQRALLQRVIERKLVDGLARDRQLDKSPEYLGQRRRLDELLLAQTYARQQLAAVPVPSGADIATFMTANPGIFANRQQLTLDQIRFVQPSNPSVLNGLEAVHTLDGVAAFLTQHEIKFSRGQASLDSAAIPAQLLSQINALPQGEPFVIPSPTGLTVNVITGRKAVANDPAQARAVAASAWRQQKVQQSIQDQIAGAKRAAKITYQKGFEPVAKPATNAALAAAKS